MSDRGARRGASLVLISLAVVALLGACSAEQAGQTLYDTGKAYCERQPHKCAGGNSTSRW